MSFSIIIPTYNEEENISFLLKEIKKCISDIKYDLLIVDGGSLDDTVAIAQETSKLLNVPLRIVTPKEGTSGLAESVLKGIKLAKYDVVVVMDADLSHPPLLIVQLVQDILSQQYDLVIASRYVKKARVVNWPLHRRALSYVATFLTRLYFPFVSDPLSGFFALNRRAVNIDKMYACGFKIGMEIISQINKDRIKEIPYIFKGRERGKSKLNFREVWLFLKQFIRLKVSHPPNSLNKL
jgi:dolichol-phosphate mannosyltransferase